MSLLLAIDCGNKWTGVALLRDGLPLAELHADLGRRQGGQLPLMVADALRLADATFGDLSLVALTVGPGYFTSLRVGLAYGLSLAWSVGCKVVPMSSLAAIALSAPDHGPVLSLIAASRSTVFAGLYQDGFLQGVEEETTVDALTADSQKGTVPWVCCADSRFEGQLPPGRARVLARSCALDLAQWAWNHQEGALSPLEVDARYLREPGIGK